MRKRWTVLDLFTKETAVGGQEPSEASTGSAGAQPREGRRPARRAAGGTGASSSTSSADTVVLHVRTRRVVVEAIEAAVQGSPIEFANPSEFVRRAVEHELARRGLLKTFK